MSTLKVKKDTTKLINRAAALTEKEFSPGEIFIITDSKGKYIVNSQVPNQMYAIGRWALLTCLMKSSTKSELMFAPLLYITFLPVYRWNKHQGREYNTQTEEIEKKQDTGLKSIIKYFNNQLNLINRDWTTPKILIHLCRFYVQFILGPLRILLIDVTRVSLSVFLDVFPSNRRL
jgi:hypothetical protein